MPLDVLLLPREDVDSAVPSATCGRSLCTALQHATTQAAAQLSWGQLTQSAQQMVRTCTSLEKCMRDEVAPPDNKRGGPDCLATYSGLQLLQGTSRACVPSFTAAYSTSLTAACVRQPAPPRKSPPPPARLRLPGHAPAGRAAMRSVDRAHHSCKAVGLATT